MSQEGARLYLLDVEGTVAPIWFVTEKLFPFARKRFADFLRDRTEQADVRADMVLLAEENRADQEPGRPQFIDAQSEQGWASALTYLFWLMDRDHKSTALKSLQGKIWKIGFESGELKSMLFADVPAALERWNATARVAIYSSGSVEAQQLFFRHSNFGDLTPLLSGYFDTRTGPKKESASYAAIVAAMRAAPRETIFFSDVVGELDAARKANCHTRLVVREGNDPVTYAHHHERIETFEGFEERRPEGAEAG